MIAIGADHGGFALKEHLVSVLTAQGIEIKDCGTCDGTAIDYPDVAKRVCDTIVDGTCEKGILVCGTGIGISIAANKITGIRCALLSDCYSARMAGEHNNANVVSLGGRVVGCDLAVELVNSWLGASFQGGRHQGRVDKIHALEK